MIQKERPNRLWGIVSLNAALMRCMQEEMKLRDNLGFAKSSSKRPNKALDKHPHPTNRCDRNSGNIKDFEKVETHCYPFFKSIRLSRTNSILRTA
jgi:hypothetical protein